MNWRRASHLQLWPRHIHNGVTPDRYQSKATWRGYTFLTRIPVRSVTVFIRIVGALAIGSLLSSFHPVSAQPITRSAGDPDIVVVGAGLAGLSAALEAARGGAKVIVMDMASVFGGHAVMSEGDVTIVNTPLQQDNGIHDSQELAYRDFMNWGKESNSEWVDYYVSHSREDIYDWLTSMGVKFNGLQDYPGNSVARAHRTQGRGLGLVSPVYRECVRNPNIKFLWNTEVVELITEHQQIIGVRVQNLRTRVQHTLHSSATILATGGFQSNLEWVRKYWPADLPLPRRLLAGSGINSVGSGLTLAVKQGAALTNMDRQWNYERGLPDPRYPGLNRGLNAAVAQSILINSSGVPLTLAGYVDEARLKAVLSQPGATYWAIFDEAGKRSFFVSGSDWGNFDAIQHTILDNRDLVKKADTLDELAAAAGLPAATLSATIQKSNKTGPIKIATPPFYAVQFFPLTRKSMGGLSVDSGARVLNTQHRSMTGLYAAGEVAGEAGINGKAALEGTFLGPAVVMGRVAARSALRDLKIPAEATSSTARLDERGTVAAPQLDSSVCNSCHNLKSLVNNERPGYWHFEHVHRVVIERRSECIQCHAKMGPPGGAGHRIDRLAQIDSCAYCHVSK
jgi:uncharacterized protein